MMNGDPNMFTHLFPILLFNNHGLDLDGKTKNPQLHYMSLLQGYLRSQFTNNDLVSQKLGIASEMIHF